MQQKVNKSTNCKPNLKLDLCSLFDLVSVTISNRAFIKVHITDGKVRADKNDNQWTEFEATLLQSPQSLVEDIGERYMTWPLLKE